eukprot:3151563-Rhodomonas_salina.3
MVLVAAVVLILEAAVALPPVTARTSQLLPFSEREPRCQASPFSFFANDSGSGRCTRGLPFFANAVMRFLGVSWNSRC